MRSSLFFDVIGCVSNDIPTTQILGLPFFTGTLEQVINIIKNEGGLLTAPAAPALVNLPRDNLYKQALEQSDILLTDSSLMVGIWNVWKRSNIPKLSGYRFLEALLRDAALKNGLNTFWVMPSDADKQKAQAWLQKAHGIYINDNHMYTAPLYDSENILDSKLEKILNSLQPHFIINNLGGGTQEKLGLFLKRHLDYRPAIICTGAALAFLTGGQANIPTWADRMGLGWLCRCLYAPKKFIPRYFNALKFIPLLLKNGHNAPQPR